MKKSLKIGGIILGVLIVFGAIGNALGGDTETNKQTNKTNNSDVQVAEKKDSSKNDAAKEKTYYIDNVQSEIDNITKSYDRIWDELWVATFSNLGTKVNIYDAYSSMNKIEQQYSELYSSVEKIPDNELSKDNKELLKEFKTNFKRAIASRETAARKAKEMFDNGELKPSEFDTIKAYVSDSDNYMINSAVSLTTLKTNYGLVDKDAKN